MKTWQSAKALAILVLRITSTNRFREYKELRIQMQRAAISVMSNIAEGFERDGRKEFINFLSIAKASAGEIRSQLYLAREMSLITESDFDEVFAISYDTSRMIGGLINYLRSSSIEGNKFKGKEKGCSPKKKNSLKDPDQHET